MPFGSLYISSDICSVDSSILQTELLLLLLLLLLVVVVVVLLLLLLLDACLHV
jgi:hypothetical protein